MLLVIIRFEIVDVFLGNWVAGKASKKLYAGDKLQNWEQRSLEIYHGIFTKIALVIIPSSVLMIMYLAISKAGLSVFFNECFNTINLSALH